MTVMAPNNVISNNRREVVRHERGDASKHHQQQTTGATGETTYVIHDRVDGTQLLQDEDATRNEQCATVGVVTEQLPHTSARLRFDRDADVPQIAVWRVCVRA